jgi:hypothetical protein
MFNAKSLLDAVVAGIASPRASEQPDSRQQNFLRDTIEAFAAARGGAWGKVFRQATGGLRDMADHATGGLDRQVDKTVRTVTGGTFEDLKRQAKEVIGRNPELAEGALVGVAGLLLGTRRGRESRPIWRDWEGSP